MLTQLEGLRTKWCNSRLRASRGVHVPLFPTKFSSYSRVPLKYFFDFGVPCSLNTLLCPCSQFYFPFLPLKAHVHHSGFQCLSFCFGTVHLLNAVFGLAVISQVTIFNYAKFPQCILGDNGPLIVP